MCVIRFTNESLAMEIIQLYIFLSMEINFQEIDHRAPVKLWLRNTTTKFDISVFFPSAFKFQTVIQTRENRKNLFYYNSQLYCTLRIKNVQGIPFSRNLVLCLFIFLGGVLVRWKCVYNEFFSRTHSVLKSTNYHIP